MKENNTSKLRDELVSVIIDGIHEVKGHEVTELDLRTLGVSICDRFIVCHGTSTTQVDAIGNKVQEFTQKQLGEKPWKTSGYENSEWIILDYFDIIVHIFLQEKRDLYKLEDLWSDATTTIHEPVATVQANN